MLRDPAVCRLAFNADFRTDRCAGSQACPWLHKSVPQPACHSSGAQHACAHARTCTHTHPPRACPLRSLAAFQQDTSWWVQRWTNQGPRASLSSGLSAHCFPGGSHPHPFLHTQGLEPQGPQAAAPHLPPAHLKEKGGGEVAKHTLCWGLFPPWVSSLALGWVVSQSQGC